MGGLKKIIQSNNYNNNNSLIGSVNLILRYRDLNL
jgi:hypothetical protein